MHLRLGLATVAITVLLVTAAGGPVAGADDPEAALRELFETIAARELDDLDGLVCREQQGVVRAAYDDVGLGIDLMASSFDDLRVEVLEPSVEVIEAGASSATARVSGTIGIEVEDDAMRALVREVMEVAAEPDDPPITPADIDAAVPLVSEALGLSQPFEATVSLELEEGEWVVCGGLGLEDAGAHDGVDPSASSAGLCALATPAELSAGSGLEYDSSTGVDEFCTYSQSDWDDFHAATVSVAVDSSLDDWREGFPADGELAIAGAPAFSSGPNLLVEAGEAVLLVTVSLPDQPPAGIDAMTQAGRIAEFFLPRLGALEIEESERRGASDAMGAASLCESLSAAELERASGRGFDEGVGDAWTCTWASPELADTVVATVSELGLDDFREILGATSATRIEGLPALTTSERAVVELPDGRSLDVTVTYDQTVEPELPADALAAIVVEWLASHVPPELDPTPTSVAGPGLLAGRDHVDDLALALPYHELSALTGITFDDPGFCADFCEYYVFDGTDGSHYAITSLEARPIEDWLEEFPGAAAREIEGQPAVLVEGIFADLGASAVAIVAIPGHETLTFAAGIGVDTGADVAIDPAATAQAMVGIGLANLIGGTD